MCSIIGWNGNFDDEVVESLCYNSRIRGLHSFGYSYAYNGNIESKKFLDYDAFVNSLKSDKPNKFIAHFRYSTSGDYQDQNNNQPITRDSLSMVFNGVLDMRTKQEMQEAYNTKMLTDNDGELAIIHKLQSDDSFIEFVKNKSFAGAFIDSSGDIKVFRNINRPSHIGEYKGAKVLASTKDILKRSGVSNTKIVGYNKFVSL
jgi:glutamine phosphoribosylpyrophosphate amidotransferase